MGTIRNVCGRRLRLGLATQKTIQVQATILLLQFIPQKGGQVCWYYWVKLH